MLPLTVSSSTCDPPPPIEPFKLSSDVLALPDRDPEVVGEGPVDGLGADVGADRRTRIESIDPLTVSSSNCSRAPEAVDVEFDAGHVERRHRTLRRPPRELGAGELETVNGSIDLYLSASVGADISAETVNGALANDLGSR